MKRNILVIALAALLLLASCATSASSGERDRYEGLILNVDTSTTYVDFSAALAEVADGQTLQLHCDAYRHRSPVRTCR